MKLTRAQRINNVASMIVSELRSKCEAYRKFLKEGIDLQAGEGMSATKVTPDELREALGENAKEIETVLDFVLDGKSNQITKGVKKAVKEIRERKPASNEAAKKGQ